MLVNTEERRRLARAVLAWIDDPPLGEWVVDADTGQPMLPVAQVTAQNCLEEWQIQGERLQREGFDQLVRDAAAKAKPHISLTGDALVALCGIADLFERVAALAEKEFAL